MTARQTIVATIEVDASHLATRAAGDERIPVAISSEYPVVREDLSTGRPYLEVLEHTPEAVDLSRAVRGLPLLASHDQRDQYGVVEELRVGNDRKLRGWLRFSRSAKGQELRQDVVDGIRNSLSVGYATGDAYRTETRPDGMTVRRYSRWTPFEVSTVPIPADPTVGVNRAASVAPKPTTTTRTTVQTDHETEQHDDTETEQRRLSSFLQMAESAGRTVAQMHEDMRRYRTPEAYGRALLQEMQDNVNHQQRMYPAAGGVSRAFLEGFSEAVFAPEGQSARDNTRRLAKETGLAARGSLVPLSSRTITSTGLGTGKEFSPILQGDMIDLMRPRMIATEFGAQIETYLGGTVSRPTITSDAAFTWLAENPGSGVAASDVGTGAIVMQPRAVSTRTTHTAQSLRTSTPETAAMIMQAHAARLAVAVDAATLAGTGSNNQPTGILYNAGVNLVAMGTNGAAVSYAKLCELEQAIDAANAPMEGLGFVSTPQIRSRMRQTMDFPSAAAGRPLWDFQNTVLGHRAMTTTSMPSTLTKGTSNGTCHAAILGDFSQVVIAYWGALEVIVDPYTDAAKGLTHITSTMYVDVGVIQPGAFAVIRDLTLA